ncbi:hypothetical protein ACOBQX_05995 [Actinokineospora sp. G85]|uniref:hypothetical protein n=1 Tax=Actinokineospora sp. G85 TaxID=3406626 RepID=UPI003C73F45B
MPVMPALMPMALLPIAALVEVLTARARRSGARWLPAATGALTGALVAGLQGVQDALVYGYAVPGLAAIAPTAAAGLLLGALAGVLGWRFGRMLRLVNPTPSTAPNKEA